MATITPVLWKSKTNKKGEHPIYIRIEAGDRRRYVSVRAYIRPADWNERLKKVRKGHKRHKEINGTIARRISKIEDELHELNRESSDVTVEKLKHAVARRSTTGDFFEYADGVVGDLQRRGQIYLYKRYKSICKKFRLYADEPLPFSEITPTLLRSYETHLVEHYKNKPSTVAANFRGLRAILYRAMREDVCQSSPNPFFQFSIREPRAERTKLSLADIKAIEALDLEVGSAVWHARNYFLFSFYCAGIRFRDLALLKRESVKEGRLTYQMSKTGSVKEIKLVSQAQEILEPYMVITGPLLFPMLDRYNLSTPTKVVNAISAQSVIVNRNLKLIAEMAGITEKVSFHIARHSFADMARKQDWSIYDISKALGHANIKVTENYLQGFDTARLDKKMDSLFSEKNDVK